MLSIMQPRETIPRFRELMREYLPLEGAEGLCTSMLDDVLICIEENEVDADLINWINDNEDASFTLSNVAEYLGMDYRLLQRYLLGCLYNQPVTLSWSMGERV